MRRQQQPVTSRQCRRGLLVGLVMWMGCAAGLSRAEAEERAPWELQPYHVQVLLAPGPSPTWTPARTASLKRRLEADARSLVGGPWRLKTGDASKQIRRATRRETGEWDRIAFGDADFPKSDKIIVLALATQGAGFRVQAQEWDRATGLWGPIIQRFAASARELPRTAFVGVHAAFSAVAKPVRVTKNQVVIRPRAQGLPARDPRSAPFQSGSVLRLAVRKSKDAPAEEMPWTYLVVDENKSSGVLCDVYSRYQNPLQLLRASSQWIAFQTAAPRRATELRLTAPGDSPKSLFGYEVLSYSPGVQGVERLGVVGLDGSLLIPPSADPLRVLVVRNGTDLVARLPLIPGAKAHLQATLAPSENSLVAEDALLSLHAALLDAVARQEVLLARAQAFAAENNKSQAEQLVQEAKTSLQAERKRLALELEKRKVRLEAAQSGAFMKKELDDLFTSLTARMEKRTEQVSGELSGPEPMQPATPGAGPPFNPLSPAPSIPGATPGAPSSP